MHLWITRSMTLHSHSTLYHLWLNILSQKYIHSKLSTIKCSWTNWPQLTCQRISRINLTDVILPIPCPPCWVDNPTFIPSSSWASVPVVGLIRLARIAYIGLTPQLHLCTLLHCQDEHPHPSQRGINYYTLSNITPPNGRVIYTIGHNRTLDGGFIWWSAGAHGWLSSTMGQ